MISAGGESIGGSFIRHPQPTSALMVPRSVGPRPAPRPRFPAPERRSPASSDRRASTPDRPSYLLGLARGSRRAGVSGRDTRTGVGPRRHGGAVRGARTAGPAPPRPDRTAGRRTARRRSRGDQCPRLGIASARARVNQRGLARAVALMDRLSYPRKFALIDPLFLAPLGQVAASLLAELEDRVAVARWGLLGIDGGRAAGLSRANHSEGPLRSSGIRRIKPETWRSVPGASKRSCHRRSGTPRRSR